MNKFSIREAVKFGFETTKSNFLFLLGILVIAAVMSYIPNLVGDANLDRSPVSMFVLFAMSVAAWLLRKVVDLGIIRAIIKLVDGTKPGFGELFSTTNLLVKSILADVVYGLMVMGGLLLFVIPGIIIAIKYHYYTYFIVDKGLGPIEALKRSGQATKGNLWNIFFLGLTLVLVNLLGIICLLIGLLFTIPLSMLASAYVYRKLSTAGSSEVDGNKMIVIFALLGLVAAVSLGWVGWLASGTMPNVLRPAPAPYSFNIEAP